MGIGGGGRKFAAWLGSRLNLGSTPAPEPTDEGLVWTFSRARIIDSAAIVPRRDPHLSLGRVRIEPNRSRRDDPATFDRVHALALKFLHENSALDAGRLESFLTRFGTATSIVDVTEWVEPFSSENPADFVRGIESVARRSESFREHFRAIQSAGGSRLLDLGRVIYLLAPDAMHLGDEWASLASANSSRVYSLADINLVLSEFSELFRIDTSATNPTVEAVNPFVRTLFSGFVPASSSEYVEIFEWMAARAVGSLVRADSSDSFIRSALPLVAVRGGCLPQLLENGAVMLAADTMRLADYLERDPQLMVEPGAKALLLHAHRLRPDASDREAQMEFALRRLSLNVEADRIAAALPARTWRPVWSSTSPTNVHRVLSENASGVLALAVVRDAAPFRAYAGLGNGGIRLLEKTRAAALDTGPTGSNAEVRGLAALTLDEADIVLAAASDATIRAFRIADIDDRATVECLWVREDRDGSPLTTATIWQPVDGNAVALSGGVSGAVWRHDLVTGEDLGALVDWGAEIRSIRTVTIENRPAAVIVAVDGRIGVVDLASSEQIASTTLAEWGDHESSFITPSCMDAIEDNGSIRILIGCAMGELFEATWSAPLGFNVAAVEYPNVPNSGVNEVVFHADPTSTIRRYVARNDGVWLRYDSSNKRPVKVFVGHAGPVLSQAVFSDPTSGEVLSLTGGSEGTVRIWRHVEVVDEALSYLRVNRHRGAIRSVEVRHNNDVVEVITGGDDGDVRIWQGSDARRGWVISKHQGSVSSFLWLTTPKGPRLVVGAHDGTIRLASPDRSTEPARLLGIAHEGVTALAASPTDGIFWSAGNDGGLTRWDALAGVARGSQVISRYGKVLSLATDSHGRVYVGGQDGSLSVVSPEQLDITSTRKFDSAVTTMAVIPDLQRLILGLASGHVYSLDISHGIQDPVRELYRHESGAVKVDGIDLHDQVAIASIGRDRKLVVIDADSRALLHEIGLEGFPTGLSASGNFIAVSTTAGATLFEFSDGHLLTSHVDGRR